MITLEDLLFYKITYVQIIYTIGEIFLQVADLIQKRKNTRNVK